VEEFILTGIPWLDKVMPMLITIVAIGWSIEKILRLIDTLLPKEVTIDNDIAEFLGRILKMLGGIIKKKE